MEGTCVSMQGEKNVMVQTFGGYRTQLDKRKPHIAHGRNTRGKPLEAKVLLPEMMIRKTENRLEMTTLNETNGLFNTTKLHPQFSNWWSTQSVEL